MQIGKLFRNIRLGIKNLMLHKLRSLLTMLGVVFGVGSVVAMLSVGEGASKQALEQIKRLGSNNIIIDAMKPIEEAGASGGGSPMRLSVYGLLYEDEQRIRETFPSALRSVPVKLIRREGRLRDRNLELRVVGTTPEWFELVRRDLIAGRTLVQRDMAERSSVVVLTEHGARRLLATEGSIGQYLQIGSDYYEVIGIVRNEATPTVGSAQSTRGGSSGGGGSGSGFQTPDRDVDAYIPIALARERYGDITTRRSTGAMEREMVQLHQLIVEARDSSQVEDLSAGIEQMLQRFHKKKDYEVRVPLTLLRQAEETKRTFNIVLGSIAAISLLVGGIGIMNIMLASVTERTREIGVRRAIGARRSQIITQFLIETVVLSTVGGLVGIGLGMLIPWIITLASGMPTEVTPYSILLSVGISMLIGIIFGLYPAVRAANLDPINALRHE